MAAKIYVCDNCGFLFTRTGECDQCPDCGKKMEIFGHSKAEEIAAEYGIPAVAKMPLDANISKLADQGRIEDYDGSALADIFKSIEKAPSKIEK